MATDLTPTAPAPPDPATLPRAQQERRRRIVDAAIALIGRNEYDAIQMRDVATEAGVALATIYRYFTSKEHLYAAALVEWVAEFPLTRRTPAIATNTDEERIRALMRRAVRAFERHPQMMRAVIVLEASNDPNARTLFEQFGAQNTAALTQALGTLDPDVAAAIVETANSVMVTRLRAWALGRCSIRDVDRSVQRALDLIFTTPPA
ncbi:MAG: TetR/AcrR family transcriptional regulator [Acidimicrobiia bacterium]|nr:TetR/AcrR family transcriptional regulator [Acidimicrobiia bacterium]